VTARGVGLIVRRGIPKRLAPLPSLAAWARRQKRSRVRESLNVRFVDDITNVRCWSVAQVQLISGSPLACALSEAPQASNPASSAQGLAADPSLFVGPSDAVAEHVFDEDDMLCCSLEPVSVEEDTRTYFDLEITATDAKAKIWLSDDEGNLAQSAVGTLKTGLLPRLGKEFPGYPVDLDRALVLVQVDSGRRPFQVLL
jgi:hypothetical protein